MAAGVDARLDALKHDYDGMGSFLTEVSSKISRELPDWARPHVNSCIFLPQLGFLTAVEMDNETGTARYGGQGLQGGTWEKTFSADRVVYYKNRWMRELDAHLGDVYAIIVGTSPPHPSQRLIFERGSDAGTSVLTRRHMGWR